MASVAVVVAGAGDLIIVGALVLAGTAELLAAGIGVVATAPPAPPVHDTQAHSDVSDTGAIQRRSR